jgi:predicted dehydrogenase
MIRWGILACGRIAKKFASDLRLVEGASLEAVASRDIEKSKAFALEYPARRVYGSYEELAADPNVDAIYIASPHSHHHEHTLLCLQHGKAVLCEKAFAINSKQALEMVALARDKNIFLMEAFWTRFLPHYIKLKALIEEGKLGEPKGVIANFGFKPPENPVARLFAPSLGGGTLLDIGVYNIFLAQSILGVPDRIKASMVRAATGVDEQCAIIFEYNNGRMASLFSSFCAHLETDADIFGTEGRVRLTSRFNEPIPSLLYYPGFADSRTPVPVWKEEGGWGYQHEIRHVNECLKKGLTESPVHPLDDTLALVQTMDRVRTEMGLAYPADK